MNDLIHKQDIIAILDEWLKVEGYNWGEQNIMRGLRSLIEDMEPVQQWIPVSERLPEDYEEVIITWVNHDPEFFYADIKDKPFTGAAVYFEGQWFWYSAKCQDYLKEYGGCYEDEMAVGIEVIAWQPLPEVYQEVRSDG